MDFTNKVVLITGAGAGIGAATALLFSKHSAKLALLDKNEANLKRIASECEELKGFKPLAIAADISVVDDLKRFVDESVNHFGRIDVLINNAGVGGLDSIRDIKLEEIFNPLLEINLRSIYLLTHFALPHLIRSKGNIVSISSNASKAIISSDFLSYAMFKSAVDQFTRIVAYDLGPDGVRANSIHPGMTYSSMLDGYGMDTEAQQKFYQDMTKDYPLKRVASAEDIANSVIYLASDLAKNITGINMITDGGRHLGAIAV